MPKRHPRCSGQNNLIATLSVADRALIVPHLELVNLEQRSPLEHADRQIDTVIFPVNCVGSVVALADHGRQIEAGLFGYEGMSGSAVITGAGTTPNETFVQVAGTALTIDAGKLHDLMDSHPSMRRHFLLFVQLLLNQAAQTALSNGHAKLEERLARWILMYHDRVPGDRLRLTHEFLAVMLGVRRAGVTVGTHLLEGKGLIRAGRGEITVLDRAGLREEANGSYGVPEAEYDRLFPSLGDALDSDRVSA